MFRDISKYEGKNLENIRTNQLLRFGKRQSDLKFKDYWCFTYRAKIQGLKIISY
jgi:hypothetical protein